MSTTEEQCPEQFTLGTFLVRCTERAGHNTSEGYLHHADLEIDGRTPCIEWDKHEQPAAAVA